MPKRHPLFHRSTWWWVIGGLMGVLVVLWLHDRYGRELPLLTVDLSEDRSVDRLPPMVPRPKNDNQYRVYEPVRFDLTPYKGKRMTGTADWVSFYPKVIDGEEVVSAVKVRFPTESLEDVEQRVWRVAKQWSVDVSDLGGFVNTARLLPDDVFGTDMRYAAVYEGYSYTPFSSPCTPTTRDRRSGGWTSISFMTSDA